MIGDGGEVRLRGRGYIRPQFQYIGPRSNGSDGRASLAYRSDSCGWISDAQGTEGGVYLSATIEKICRRHQEQLMGESNKDSGVIQVLAERMEKQRLPRALALKAVVDRGERLDAMELEFLDGVFQDARQMKPLLDAHPEWQELASRMMQLYKEITAKALENEQKFQRGS